MLAVREAVSSPLPNQKLIQDVNQDANLALLDLEKGLKTSKAGEQCESIAQVPSLLEKYPFPLMVNSVFLKLADVFRTGSNFTKLCILKAIQNSKQHLVKILNVDEFCRRFSAVTHSNDPIARAVTLRVFGNIASIAGERKNIHHSIHTSLDSNDIVEKEAAIFALKSFAEQSRSFAEGIWKKLSELTQDLETPINIKLELIQVFRFICHDVVTSSQVYELCTEKLLSTFPVFEFTLQLLNVSTQLVLSTLANIEKQISVLLQYITNDPRHSIKLIAAQNLLLIAKKAHHMWTPSLVEELCKSIVLMLQPILKEKLLMVVIALAQFSDSKHLFEEKSKKSLEELTTDLSMNVSSLALQVKVLLDLLFQVDNFDEELTDIQIQISLTSAEENFLAFKRSIITAKLILTAHEQARENPSLKEFLLECLFSLKDKYAIEVCKLLAAVSEVHRSFLTDCIDKLFEVFQKYLSDSQADHSKTVTIISFLIIQASCDCNSLEYQERFLKILFDSHLKHDYWLLYKVARVAASSSVFSMISSELFKEIQTKVSSEHYSFWLQALAKFQLGESLLVKDVISVESFLSSLKNSLSYYLEGLTLLKVAITTKHPLYFQFKFARLRCDMLKAYIQLLVCCTSLKLHPPPQMIFEDKQQNSMKSKLQTCADSFTEVSLGYENLYRQCFNSDKTSVTVVQLLMETCKLTAYAIESLILQKPSESSIHANEKFKEENICRENLFCNRLDTINSQLFNRIQEVQSSTRGKDLSDIQINCLTTLVHKHLSVGISYPRYFFVSPQNVSLQLSISPANSTLENPTAVNITHSFSVLVEGFLIQDHLKKRIRDVSKVNLRLKVTPNENVRLPSKHLKPVQSGADVFFDCLDLQSNFFSSQFLLEFYHIGLHTIKISCGVRDELGIDWDTGPYYTLYADVYEQTTTRRK